jgi:hypothetical protein
MPLGTTVHHPFLMATIQWTSPYEVTHTASLHQMPAPQLANLRPIWLHTPHALIGLLNLQLFPERMHRTLYMFATELHYVNCPNHYTSDTTQNQSTHTFALNFLLGQPHYNWYWSWVGTRLNSFWPLPSSPSNPVPNPVSILTFNISGSGLSSLLSQLCRYFFSPPFSYLGSTSVESIAKYILYTCITPPNYSANYNHLQSKQCWLS